MMQGGYLTLVNFDSTTPYIIAKLSMGPFTPIARGVKYDVSHRGYSDTERSIVVL